MLPNGTAASIDTASWQLPPVFEWLQQSGGIAAAEMRRTFNCGVGMVLAIEATDVDACLRRLADLGETAWEIGEVVERGPGPAILFA